MWRDHVEFFAEEDLSEDMIENIYAELEYLEVNPLNLNAVSKEQLEQFPLLTAEQSASLYNFLSLNRPLYSIYELRNVKLLDYNTVALILPFFVVESPPEKSPTPNEILKGGRHDLHLRFDKTLTKRAGYHDYSDSILEKYPNRKYVGEDFYTSLRYRFSSSDHLQMGFTAEKDPGEKFIRKGSAKTFDHYGYHFVLQDLGVLKSLVVGDYRVSWGQGLVLNNDFMLPKSWGMNRLIRQTQSPKSHFSTSEYGYFRGVASTIGIGDLSLSTIFSRKKIDTNLSESGEITSFKTDGYHRTPGELVKKHNTREQVEGINLNIKKDHFQIGISSIHYRYDRRYNPRLKIYNQYVMRDSTNMNTSIDYLYRAGNLSFAGETAMGKNGAVATINILRYSPSSELSMIALHRYFPVRYQGMYANAFKESGDVSNERGLYLGVSCSPFRRVRVEMYADIVQFPWPKYNIDRPSKALDLYFLTTYNPTSVSSIQLRYKFKQKEKNQLKSDINIKSIEPYHTQKIRLRYEYTSVNDWNFRTTADAVIYKETYTPIEKGMMLSQNIRYAWSDQSSSDIFVAYFDSPSYNARLYSYERSLVSSFYIPSFYGNGFRFAFTSRFAISKRLLFAVKGAHTLYLDRDTIGSGTEKIAGNHRTDLYTYLRWKF